MEFDYITTAECDGCGRRNPGVMFHHHGTPVLFLCATCDHQSFERVARQDIDEWVDHDWKMDEVEEIMAS